MKPAESCPLCVRRQERLFEIEGELSGRDEHIRELELQVARLERLHGDPVIVWPPTPAPNINEGHV